MCVSNSLLTSAGEYLCNPRCERSSRSSCDGKETRKGAPKWGNRPLRADSCRGAMLLTLRKFWAAGTNQEDSCQWSTVQYTDQTLCGTTWKRWSWAEYELINMCCWPCRCHLWSLWSCTVRAAATEPKAQPSPGGMNPSPVDPGNRQGLLTCKKTSSLCDVWGREQEI